jgi:uncharacterized protein (TIGR00369 family)
MLPGIVHRLDARATNIVTRLVGEIATIADRGIRIGGQSGTWQWKGKRMARKTGKAVESKVQNVAQKEAVELVRRRLRESKATELLGFDVESVHEGRAVLRMDVLPHHKQVHGVVHGGILAALADTTAAIAAYTVLPIGTEIATLELKINYLEPVPGGRVLADAKVLRKGRNFIVTECDIFIADGSLAAKAILTFSAAIGQVM